MNNEIYSAAATVNEIEINNTSKMRFMLVQLKKAYNQPKLKQKVEKNPSISSGLILVPFNTPSLGLFELLHLSKIIIS